MMNTKFNLGKLVRESVKRLTPYSSARDEFKDFRKDMVFLDANENPNNNGWNRYPDPQQTVLKNHIATWKSVESNNILLGNGSDEVLDLIFRAFCEPRQDNIIILPPTYGMYQVLADLNTIEVRQVELNDKFQPKEDDLLMEVDDNTKIVFLCSPNNPSANSFNSKKIEFILQEFSGLVVIDEAYIDFSTEKSWISKLKQYPNLIVTQTMSKAFGMAGIRLGICYASEEIISVLNKIKPPYNVNSLTQNKALEQLKDIKTIQKQVEAIVEQRHFLIDSLSTIGFIKKIYPSDANFILIKVDDAQLRYSQLLDKGIVVRDRSKLPLCTNCLRITIGSASENLVLTRVFKELDQIN